MTLLQKYVDDLEKDLLMEPNIRQPESLFGNLPRVIDNSQADRNENNLSHICLFSGAGDLDSLRKQQQQIRATANEFAQEVKRAVAAAVEKNQAAKISSN